jgi:hypothetical protein
MSNSSVLEPDLSVMLDPPAVEESEKFDLPKSVSPVCFCVPSARPVKEAALCLLEWHRAGYLLAVWRDQQDDLARVLHAHSAGVILLEGKYPGYASAVNALAKEVLAANPRIQWLVSGGDDTHPDQYNSPEKIAVQLNAYFGGTFGVMQPTGDRWADGSIDNIAGSPWMGRDWCRRAHGGAGPMCPEFFHMETDVALLWAAEREGVYLRRPDLTHTHYHFCRTPDGRVDWSNPIPEHLKFVNGPVHIPHAKNVLHDFKLNYDKMWRPIA